MALFTLDACMYISLVILVMIGPPHVAAAWQRLAGWLQDRTHLFAGCARHAAGVQGAAAAACMLGCRR